MLDDRHSAGLIIAQLVAEKRASWDGSGWLNTLHVRQPRRERSAEGISPLLPASHAATGDLTSFANNDIVVAPYG
jgi:hypothetical protein